MRRIVIWLASTVTIVVLLFGYHTSTNNTTPTSGTSVNSKVATSAAKKTYTGASADTRWGPVQVKITVADGKITAVEVPVSPDGNHRDIEINDQALPTLIDETVAAQSAKIDMVSGATVTSEGYLQSLQSALDKAGL